ncbi:MAG: LysR family transcriptional regulator [Luteimonas sp.]
MIETNELCVFVSVVKRASFAQAAAMHTLTPSGVSRIVSRLEARLGARLLQRSTRKLSLTPAGSLFFARAVEILRSVADAQDEVARDSLAPRGVLRMTVPTVFGRLHVLPLLAQFMQRFPLLKLDINFTDRYVDLIEQGIDLAIRVGAVPDSRLVARRLCSNRKLLVASPDYLQRRGTPQTAVELVEHDCLVFMAHSQPHVWRLSGAEGPMTVAVSGPVISNNGEVATEAAKQGLGVAPGATFSIGSALLSGELVRVLPEYEFDYSGIYLLFPTARQLPKKVRLMADTLVQAFPDPPRWDLPLAERFADFSAVVHDADARML